MTKRTKRTKERPHWLDDPMIRIITAWTEAFNAGSCYNQMVWVLIADDLKGRYRIKALQPHEQSADMITLNHVSAAVHRSLTGAVRGMRKERQKAREAEQAKSKANQRLAAHLLGRRRGGSPA